MQESARLLIRGNFKMRKLLMFLIVLATYHAVLAADNPLLLPPPNEFIPGQVTMHQLSTHPLGVMPMFIVGDDAYSKRWLRANSATLKTIHAMGIIAHADSSTDMKTLEAIAGVKLVPANLNGLSRVIQTQHYPLLIYKGWVLQ